MPRPTYDKNVIYSGVEEEEDEIFVVMATDAVTDPRTMMVHPHNTLITYFAVMYPGIFDDLTSLAICGLSHLYDLLVTMEKYVYFCCRRLCVLRYFLCILWV